MNVRPASADEVERCGKHKQMKENMRRGRCDGKAEQMLRFRHRIDESDSTAGALAGTHTNTGTQFLFLFLFLGTLILPHIKTWIFPAIVLISIY